MRLTVIGWYGTETIGDRAILAGIYNILCEIVDDIDVHLGALEPDFTKRTLIEDERFYREISGNKINSLSIFNSLKKSELRSNIKASDLVIVGGGPLMDIEPMHMLAYAFAYARKHGVKTALFGNGWGPLKQPEYIQAAIKLVHSSDLIIFRDAKSKEQLITHIGKDVSNVYNACDPAVFCASFFSANHPTTPAETPYIAINFRDVTLDQYDGNADEHERLMIAVLDKLASIHSLPIMLVPMHSYFIGGDDRAILNRIRRHSGLNDVFVLNNPPTLEEVMTIYANASACVGMRFHSVLLQTFLNGKNFILDYTDPTKGKTIGLLKDLDFLAQFPQRYISLVKGETDLTNSDLELTEAFTPDGQFVERNRSVYISNLKSLLGV